MSRTTTHILYGVSTAQTLLLRALEGRPTSGTFKVFRDYADDTGVVEFSGTATVDTVTTTVSVVSGTSQADQRRVNLASTTGVIVGRKYLLSDNGMQEWVEPVEIVSASYIHVRHPLRNDYSTTATFVSTSLSATVDSTWVNLATSIGDQSDPNPDYRVRWEYIVSGLTKVAYSYFDVARSTSGHHVDVDDLNARAPGLFDSLPTEYLTEQGRPIIDSAFRAVQARLAALRIELDAIRDAQFIDELVIMQSLYQFAMGGWKPAGMTSTEYIEATRTALDRFIEQHVQATLKHPVAVGQSSAAERPMAVPYWSK